MNDSKKSNREIISDNEIIELFRQRNEKAIQMTEKKYGTLIYRIAYNILHDKDDCEECRNDVYLGLWNAIPPATPVVFPAFIITLPSANFFTICPLKLIFFFFFFLNV